MRKKLRDRALASDVIRGGVALGLSFSSGVGFAIVAAVARLNHPPLWRRPGRSGEFGPRDPVDWGLISL